MPVTGKQVTGMKSAECGQSDAPQGSAFGQHFQHLNKDIYLVIDSILTQHIHITKLGGDGERKTSKLILFNYFYRLE